MADTPKTVQDVLKAEKDALLATINAGGTLSPESIRHLALLEIATK